jgi:uncharacterized protein
VRILRAADCKRMPWKNGGGETAEIAVEPADAALDAIDWRISMARVDCDGAFSNFPGIDRTLVILAGAGLRLHVAALPAVELTRASPPHSFPADVATRAELLGGPITDLNVMTRRGRFVHRLRRVQVGVATTLPLAAATTLILCVEGRASLAVDGVDACIGVRDSALLSDGAHSLRVSGDPAASLLVVELEPA